MNLEVILVEGLICLSLTNRQLGSEYKSIFTNHFAVFFHWIINYCNSVFTGLSEKSIWQLQLILNTAARVLTNTKKVDHIALFLRSLQFLSLRKYITELLQNYEPSRPLRSSGTGLLSVPRTENKHGEAAFSFHSSNIWNKLQVCRNPQCF